MNRTNRKIALKWVRSFPKTKIIISPEFFPDGVDTMLLAELSKTHYILKYGVKGAFIVHKQNPDLVVTCKGGYVSGAIVVDGDVMMLPTEHFAWIVNNQVYPDLG